MCTPSTATAPNWKPTELTWSAPLWHSLIRNNMPSAELETYRAYLERTALAQSYQKQYAQSLTYTDDELRQAEAENFNAYSSYSYNTYYLAASRFLTGGTKNEDAEDGTETVNGYYVVYFLSSTDNAFPLSNVRHILAAFEGGTKDETTGATTYSDEEKAAAKKKAEDLLEQWKSGDATEDSFAAAFEGGTKDETTGATTYSDEEKAAAKKKAEDLLEQWKSGDATEDSFAALANESSADGNGTTGGLYENIGPDTNFVEPFKAWATAEHKPGDTGIVETQYGYHVMYYVGQTDYTYRDYQIENQLRSEDVSEWYTNTVEATTIVETQYGYHVMYYVGQTDYTYRDYQIENQLRSEDVSEWYTNTVEATTVTDGDTSHLKLDLVLSNGK